jgi:hypothetical protein
MLAQEARPARLETVRDVGKRLGIQSDTGFRIRPRKLHQELKRGASVRYVLAEAPKFSEGCDYRPLVRKVHADFRQ